MRVHSWSGNIRELKHVVRVAVLKSRGEIITPKELDFDTPTTGAHVQFKLKTGDEKSKITAAIAHADGNLTKAANLLGISHRTLWEKRKKYGLI
ncbi:helix-turn-helix domain-containing protein [Bacteroides acidifaciens]|nr:helix-turn-helix domain-containing protein [Bacteroides acidifaciens]